MKYNFIFIIILFSFITAFGLTKPEMRYQDKIRIREAINISKQFGDKIWKGINDVPFVIILVTDSVEFLINHPYPSKEISQLADFVSFNKYKEDFYKSQFSQLIQSGLKDEKRVCFYAIGFAEGLILDKLNSKWHDNFLINKFYIEHYSDKYK